MQVGEKRNTLPNVAEYGTTYLNFWKTYLTITTGPIYYMINKKEFWHRLSLTRSHPAPNPRTHIRQSEPWMIKKISLLPQAHPSGSRL